MKFTFSSWRIAEEKEKISLSASCSNSDASYARQRAWWTQMKSSHRTKFYLQMPSYLILIPPWTAFIVCSTTLWSEVGSPQKYPLIIFIDWWVMFYLKLKKILAKIGNLCLVSGNWTTEQVSSVPCHLVSSKEHGHFVAVTLQWLYQDLHLQLVNNSTANSLTSGSSTSKQISDALSD